MVFWSVLDEVCIEVSGVEIPLFILVRTSDLSSDNPESDLDPVVVGTCSSPSGCRTHGGPRPKV